MLEQLQFLLDEIACNGGSMVIDLMSDGQSELAADFERLGLPRWLEP